MSLSDIKTLRLKTSNDHGLSGRIDSSNQKDSSTSRIRVFVAFTLNILLNNFGEYLELPSVVFC